MIKIQREIIRSKKLFKMKYKAQGNRLNTSQILQLSTNTATSGRNNL